MASTSGTSADVYPILVFGENAYGTVPLRGMGSVEPSIIPVGQKTKDDPLGQRGYVGWKSWHLCLPSMRPPPTPPRVCSRATA